MENEIRERISQVQSWFVSQGKTLSFAESCTGGLLSGMVAERPGCSAYFWGSIVSYHNSVKESLLQVPGSTIRCLGEVSVPTAKYMAQGVREELGTDWSVSITGIAGPTGGSPEKPVGTVCFAVVGPGFAATSKQSFSGHERRKIQLESAKFAIDFLWDSISS